MGGLIFRVLLLEKNQALYGVAIEADNYIDSYLERYIDMAEILINDAPKKAKELFDKGFVAFEHNNLDYAVDMFESALHVCPGLLSARKFLRAAEIKMFKDKKGGNITHFISKIKGMPQYAKTASLIKSGKADQAVEAAEKLLRMDPLNVGFVLLFAKAADLDDLPEAAIQTLEIAKEYYPDNAEILKALGASYQSAGRTKDARDCFEKLCDMFPNSPEILKAAKDAMAVDSMNKGGWTDAADGGSFRDMIKDSKEAVLLEQESKAVKSDKDVESLIAVTKEKIESDAGNINHYRSLARLYVQQESFAEAISILEKAIEISSGDPEVDAAISRIKLQQFDYDIEQIKATGDADALATKEHERVQFLFDDLQQRVERYPNDLVLRFDWGVMLFENDYLNEAIQQFQLSQKNPQFKTRSLYYLGMCFKKKEQYDMAIEQLEMATAEISSMDDTKKDITYELGLIAEATGDAEKAAGYFKQIYQVDIGYKDVADKVEKVYK